jgi:hypothetical protein
MATSGTKTFELDVSEYIEEAYDRCGLEARTGYDARTARRSLNLLLAEWSNRGVNHWTVDQTDQTLTSGDSEYDLGVTCIDIVDAIIRHPSDIGETGQRDYNINRVSRQEFFSIPNKLQRGRPTKFYVDRQIAPVVKLWPVPDAAYVLVMNKLVRMDDATYSQNTLEIPFRFYPALAAGLAYYLSLKKAPDRTVVLKQLYEEEYLRATMEDRDRASFRAVPGRRRA